MNARSLTRCQSRVLQTVIILDAVLFSCAPEEHVAKTKEEVCYCDTDYPPCCCRSPIALDLAGDGLKLTTWQDGVVFNLLPWVGPEYRAWTAEGSDDAWLALDLDGNNLITSGIELFGDMTVQPAPANGEKKNGFLALAQHDDNGDRVIDARDDVFEELRAWQDKNHDGISQPDELHTMPDVGIASLSVDYDQIRQADGNGNLLRYSASVEGTPGSTVGMTAWDVVLTSPTGAERKAYGIPETPLPEDDLPPPTDDDQDIDSIGADIISKGYSKDSQPSKKNKVNGCYFHQAGEIAKVINWAVATGWWTNVDCASDLAKVKVWLYNLYQGNYVKIAGPIQRTIPPGGPPLNIVEAPYVCEFTHTTTWRGVVDVDVVYVIDDATQLLMPEDLACSAFARSRPQCD